jgi:hypothetical protein
MNPLFNTNNTQSNSSFVPLNNNNPLPFGSVQANNPMLLTNNMHNNNQPRPLFNPLNGNNINTQPQPFQQNMQQNNTFNTNPFMITGANTNQVNRSGGSMFNMPGFNTNNQPFQSAVNSQPLASQFNNPFNSSSTSHTNINNNIQNPFGTGGGNNRTGSISVLDAVEPQGRVYKPVRR